MKKIIFLLLLALLLTSCTAKVEIEESPEEKTEITDVKEDITPQENELPAVVIPEENETTEDVEVPEVPEEIEEPEVSEEPEEIVAPEEDLTTLPEAPAIIPDENEIPAVIVPEENELEAVDPDFSDITEEELQDLLDSFLSEGTVVELPIIPIN